MPNLPLSILNLWMLEKLYKKQMKESIPDDVAAELR